jgi:hypothetical protein
MLPGGPSEIPRVSLAIPKIPIFRSCFLVGARIRDMGTGEDTARGDPTDPIAGLRGTDRLALAALFDGDRDRFRRVLKSRLNPRLRARLDVSDVVDESSLDVAHDLDAYLADAKMSPLLRLRRHVGRRSTTLHRQHQGTRMRDVGLVISLDQWALPEARSAAHASMMLGRPTSPTQATERAERMLRVQEARIAWTTSIVESSLCRTSRGPDVPRQPMCSGSRTRRGRSGTAAP